VEQLQLDFGIALTQAYFSGSGVGSGRMWIVGCCGRCQPGFMKPQVPHSPMAGVSVSALPLPRSFRPCRLAAQVLAVFSGCCTCNSIALKSGNGPKVEIQSPPLLDDFERGSNISLS